MFKICCHYFYTARILGRKNILTHFSKKNVSFICTLNNNELLPWMRNHIAQIHSSVVNCKRIDDDTGPTDKELATKEMFFKQLPTKNKATFLLALQSYIEKDTVKRGHVEFIFAALRCMEEYNAHCDLEVYKKLMDIFPKGKMIAKNIIQAEFYHFPRHQECGVYLLDQMEHHGVCPDKEMSDIILNCFGKSSAVFKKFARMLYWMPKLKNANPYLLPDPLPSDVEQLARLALKKMSVDPCTKIAHFKTEDLEDSVDKTWIVSAQSPIQQKLLQKHSVEKPLYVEGAHLVWLRKLSLSYFILRADPSPRPHLDVDDDDVSNLSLYMFGEPKPVELTLTPSTVHEQEDGTILAMCVTGTSSKDSVLSWIRFLHESNPMLDTIPVLFTLRSSSSAVTTVNVDGQAATGSEALHEDNDQNVSSEIER